MRRDLTETIESVVASTPAIKQAAGKLREWNIRLFLESPFRPIKNLLNGTWLEHPLHPVLTDIPIGAWTMAMVLDAVGLITDDEGLGQASGIATGVGTAGALGAAVTGLMDWTDTDPPEVEVGFIHALSNIAATILFAASFIWRWRDNWKTRPRHLLLSGFGYLIVTFGAYLGGSLVFRQGVMINRNAYRRGPKDFVSVGRLEDLMPDKPRRVEANGQPVLLLRRGEQVHAIGAVCSHYGGPLEKGRLVDDCIECPWHYSMFSIEDGSYKRGPTSSPVPAYDVRITDGQVQVRLRQ